MIRSTLRAFGVVGKALFYGFRSSPLGTSLLLLANIAMGLVSIARVWVLQGITLVLLRALNPHVATTLHGMARVKPTLPWLIAFAGLLLLNNLVSSLTPIITDRTALLVKQSLTLDLLRLICRAPLEKLDQSEFHNHLSQARNGAGQIAYFLPPVLDLLQQFVTATSLLTYLGTVYWALPIVLIAASIPDARTNFRAAVQINEAINNRTEDQRKAAYVGNLMTKRDAIQEVHVFDLKDYLPRSWRTTQQTINRSMFALERKRIGKGNVSSNILALAYAACQVALIVASSAGKLSIPLMVSLLRGVSDLKGAISTIPWKIYQSSYSYTPLRHLFDLMHEARAWKSIPISVKSFQGPLRESIECEQLTFTYEGQEQPSLQGVDLVLRPGEVVALVGENGSGKTTLAKMLLGLYHPQRGSVRYDGVDGRLLDPDSLLRNMSAIFQDFGRYELTTRENIGFGDLSAMNDDVRLLDALRRAGADDVIAQLPYGLESILGKSFADGTDLSGGQWQKLACARALLRNAALLVLDEPTAALDPKAEVEVLSQFMRLAKGRTTLIISHRIGCARLADRIVVLDRGRVIEEGSHDQLLHRQGKYAELFYLQAQWYA